MTSKQRRPTDPTPEQIAEMCLKIQSEWSPEERRRRTASAYRTETPMVETVSAGAIRAAVERDS